MNLMKLVKLCLFVIFLLFLAVDEVAAAGEQVGYSIRAIIPENQLDSDQTYFDLLMHPEQKQEIQVEVFNSSHEDASFYIQITNATTNRNGLIDYTNTASPELDESLKHPLTDIASLEETQIHIPAGESKVVSISLEMPEEVFDGTRLGAFYIEKVLEEEESEIQGVQIQNKYAYVIAIQLRENDKGVKPELHLKEVRPDLVNYRTAIIASIQNNVPVIVNNLQLEASILDSSGKEMIRKEVANYRMAPNSTMDFAIEMENRDFEPGNYTLRLKATTDEGDWEWQEDFEIHEEKAEAMNEQAVKDVSVDEGRTVYSNYIIAGLVGIIFVLLLVIYRERSGE